MAEAAIPFFRLNLTESNCPERNINAPGQSSAGSGDLSQKTHRIVPRSDQWAEELFALKEMENGEVITIPYT